MMNWNYRVVRTPIASEEQFVIHEIYYNADGGVAMWSQNAMQPFGMTAAELAHDLQLMTSALELPIIEFDDLPGAKATVIVRGFDPCPVGQCTSKGRTHDHPLRQMPAGFEDTLDWWKTYYEEARGPQ